jgi:predicted nuclease of predicted toxin-antitoxin system
LKPLLEEMYPPGLVDVPRADDVDTCTVVELGLAGSSDPEVFAAAIADGRTVLTENVADFTHISSEHVVAGNITRAF